MKSTKSRQHMINLPSQIAKSVLARTTGHRRVIMNSTIHADYPEPFTWPKYHRACKKSKSDPEIFLGSSEDNWLYSIKVGDKNVVIYK